MTTLAIFLKKPKNRQPFPPYMLLKPHFTCRIGFDTALCAQTLHLLKIRVVRQVPHIKE